MGDTTVDAAALKAKEEEIEKLKVAVEKEKTRVENAEKKFADWGNELGEIRKDKESLKETLTEAQKTIQELKLAVAGSAIAPKDDEGHIKVPKPNLTPEDIEGQLNDDQKKVGEKVFATLSEAEKVQYASDPQFKLAFLKRLQENAPLVPKSPWTTTKEATPKGKSGLDSILDRVFAKKTRASYVPEGPNSRIPVSGLEEGKPEYVEDDRVH